MARRDERARGAATIQARYRGNKEVGADGWLAERLTGGRNTGASKRSAALDRWNARASAFGCVMSGSSPPRTVRVSKGERRTLADTTRHDGRPQLILIADANARSPCCGAAQRAAARGLMERKRGAINRIQRVFRNKLMFRHLRAHVAGARRTAGMIQRCVQVLEMPLVRSALQHL